jgi:hypothetical protein
VLDERVETGRGEILNARKGGKKVVAGMETNSGVEATKSSLRIEKVFMRCH